MSLWVAFPTWGIPARRDSADSPTGVGLAEGTAAAPHSSAAGQGPMHPARRLLRAPSGEAGLSLPGLLPKN